MKSGSHCATFCFNPVDASVRGTNFIEIIVLLFSIIQEVQHILQILYKKIYWNLQTEQKRQKFKCFLKPSFSECKSDIHTLSVIQNVDFFSLFSVMITLVYEKSVQGHCLVIPSSGFYIIICKGGLIASHLTTEMYNPKNQINPYDLFVASSNMEMF